MPIRPRWFWKVVTGSDPMIYLDTCYLLKCYLTEHGSAEVRQLTLTADGLASCSLARFELIAPE